MSPVADKSLKVALNYNPHIPAYMLGMKKPPKKLPPFFGSGDANEAVYYLLGNFVVWQSTPGSIEWMATIIKKPGKGK